MIDEKLLSVINKLLQIKEILAPSSNIEKSLEKINNKEDSSFADIVRQSKEIVDKLYSHICDIKTTFYGEFVKENDSCESRNNSDNGDLSSSYKSCSDSAEQDSQSSNIADLENEKGANKDNQSQNSLNLSNVTEACDPDESTKLLGDTGNAKALEKQGDNSNIIEDSFIENNEDSDSSKDEIMNSAKQNGNADMSDIAKQEDCDAEKQNLPIKPLIKLVDISKLVDPSIANKKKGFSDTSVIVLNSSDEESDELSREPKKPTKNTDNKNMSKRKSKRSPSSSKSKSISDKENDKDASLENGTRKRQLRKRSTTVVVELDSTDSESDDEKNEEPKVNGTETKSSSEDESVKPKWLKKAENIFDVSSSSDEDLDAKKNENNTSSKNKVSSSSSDDDSKPDGKQKNKHTNSGSELESNAYSSNDSLSDKDKSPKKNKNKKKSMKSSGNNSQEGVQKKKHVGSRSEDESNANSSNESISNKKKKKKSLSSDEELKKSVKRRRTDPMKNVNLTDVEDSNSDNNASPDLERTNSRKKHTKTTKKQQKKDTGKTELSIPLARVPCEKLKEVYERNKEALEIKRLTNMATLKNKRSLAQKSSSSASGDNKKKFKKQDSDKSDGEVHTGTDTDIETNHSVPSIQENDSGTEAMAEVVQNDISAEDDQEKTPDCIDSDDSITKKKNQKEKSKKARSSKNESNKENKDDNESEESDKDNDKRKKKWKNDKLLTGKLSSSDSEAEFEKAGSRLKNRKAKDSSKKKKKRTKNVIDSDDSDKSEKSSGDEFQTKPKSSSSSSSSESEEDNEETNKPKPKRKRIRKTKESSSDDEDKSTRKQIRKVIGRDSLSETTKKAEADEKERKARILEKQKKYNQIFESRDVNATVDKLVLDFNEETEEELLKVDEKMVKKLKPHQATGIKFMWDACFETIERAKSTKGSGCILAHCMGLGKTLQVITLTHALLTNSEKTGIERVMVVCPVNTVLNWKSEYKKWLPNDEDFEVYELVSCKQNYERQYQVTDWFKTGGVLIIGYNMFRTISNPTNKRISKKMRNAFCEGLVDPGPDLVICDEGHLLKNEKTNLSIAMNRVKTQRRIVLTGTPLQNNLKEYWCMVQFVKPNLLGTYKEYLNRFVNPIINGQYTDSTLHDIQVMRKRAHVLHKMLDGVVQRKDYAVLEPYLPPKHEYVLFISLTDVQIKLYEYYMQNLTKRNDGGKGTSFIFTDFQQLQRISTHPRVLLDKSIEDKEKKDKLDDEESEGSIKDFIDDGSDEKSSKASNSNSDSSSDDDSEKGASTTRTTRLTRALRRENNDPDSENEELEKEWWQEFCDGDELDNLNNSGKMFLLFEILKECEQIGDKILIFSQSLYTLNCIEYFLNKIDEATQAGKTDLVGGHSGSWSLGLDYFRLDGSSSCDNRASWCDQFNNPSNIRARLFLISTKAGGLGINLTAANRVIIFDVSWNPSHDIQSIYRVYRFGQKKPSYVYRFVAYGTMEMKIYERQVTKQAISKRVIDEQQIDRHYNQNDLQELYKCDLHPSERPIPLVPKDVLLGEMLHTYDKYIYKYHEHQSLLENKEEECLNEEERKAAWEEFENEKVNRYNYNTPNNAGYSTHTIAAALTNIVRRDNPLWTDMQIKAVIPALLQQLQVQVQGGDMSMYIRVQQEIKLMQAQNAQKIREQFYQQQVLRMIQQQQQQQNLMGNLQIDPSNLSSLLNSGSNGTSSNEVIELN